MSGAPRVALLVPVFPVLSETFIVRKWLGLLDRGWDVHVVCGRFDPEAWERDGRLRRFRRRVHEVGAGRSVRRIIRSAPRALGRLARRPGAALAHGLALRSLGPNRAAKRLFLDGPLLALRPHLVHFEFGSSAPQRMDLGNLLGTRQVVSFRGFDLNYVGLDDPTYYDPVWNRADAVHFLGSDLRRRAIHRGCPEDKEYALIPPAVDAGAFVPASPRPSSDGPLRVISVGRLEWKKGYDYGLRAARILKERGVRFTYTLAGDGAELSSLAYGRREMGLEEQVRLTGSLSHEEVSTELKKADVFLHPAVSEGFCNAVLEAQAMELPVVATDADGLRENVADGETGLIAPRRDPEALAEHLAVLAGDPVLRLRMGRAGRRRVIEHFPPERELDGFERLYRRVLEK